MALDKSWKKEHDKLLSNLSEQSNPKKGFDKHDEIKAKSKEYCCEDFKIARQFGWIKKMKWFNIYYLGDSIQNLGCPYCPFCGKEL